jgi:sarcosine oxidase/L-pipecolate oxidase
MNSNNNIDVICLDLSKAFDSVIHSKLLYKLKQYGLSDDLYVWIKNFIMGRIQATRIEGHVSQVKPVVSGVPQGSVLGPVLFQLYVERPTNFYQM